MAIDMACWDILGQVTGCSVCTLLGGRCGDDCREFADDDIVAEGSKKPAYLQRQSRLALVME